MIIAMRPYNTLSHSFDESFPYQPFLMPCYHSIMLRLETMDIDFEIKECSIRSIGTLFSQCGDQLTSRLPMVLQLLQKRLENETTRTVTLKAISFIATSALPLNLNDFLMNSSEDLANYLKQYSRSLKQQTLFTLDALLNHNSTTISESIAFVIIKETSFLLSDNDLHLCHLSLKVLTSLLKKNPTVVCSSIANYCYLKLILLAKSSLLQGQALSSLILVLQEMIFANYSKFSFEIMFKDLYSLSTGMNTSSSSSSSSASSSSSSSTTAAAAAAAGGHSRQSLSNLSKCIAGILSTLSHQQLLETIHLISKDINSTDDIKCQLSLLTIGETGINHDFSSFSNLKDMILNCFDRSSEDVKFASAYCLGHISVGGIHTFLPLVLQSIETSSHQTRQQYLLLTSLKETINIFATNSSLSSTSSPASSASPSSSSPFSSYLPSILPILLQQNKSEEESIRNMVGECFGILMTISPNDIIPVLLDVYSKENSNKLSLRTVVNAFKSALTRHLSSQASTAISQVIETIFPLLKDSDLDVKKAAILMVNTAAHHNPNIIHRFIVNYVNPVLYETLQIKLERVVD
jgi:hypothetical protein